VTFLEKKKECSREQNLFKFLMGEERDIVCLADETNRGA
jgi:hypothetical protein